MLARGPRLGCRALEAPDATAPSPACPGPWMEVTFLSSQALGVPGREGASSQGGASGAGSTGVTPTRLDPSLPGPTPSACPRQEAAVLEVPLPWPASDSPCLQGWQMGPVRGRQVCLGLRPHPRPAGGGRRAEQACRWWPRRGAARADGLTVRTDGGPGRGPEPAPSAPGPWWDSPHPPGAKLG